MGCRKRAASHIQRKGGWPWLRAAKYPPSGRQICRRHRHNVARWVILPLHYADDGIVILGQYIWDKPSCICLNKDTTSKGGRADLKKKKPVLYTIEREYLKKYSVEELLARIITSHLQKLGR